MTVPPPVTPTPARLSRSCRVVRMMIDTGSPLSGRVVRSSGRCARPRSGRRVGVGPGCGDRCRSGLGSGCREVQGSGSSGLHMPGAAYLAKITSNTARASGVSSPLRVLLPPRRCWGPMVIPRVRLRSVSSGAGPSWSSRNRVSSATSPSSLGPTPAAVRTRSASNWSRVPASTKPGSLVIDLRITSTCSGVIARGPGRPRSPRARVPGVPRVKCSSWSQQRGLGQPAVRFGAGDPPPDPEHVLQDLAPISLGVVSACSRASIR